MDGTVAYFEAQRTHDEQIVDLRPHRDTQNPLTLLQTRRNAIAPVSRLPNEILVDIFLILRNRSKSSLRRWHRVAQICRHWRYVAIEAPILWTDIHVFSHEYTLLMLERSQKAPLDVRFPDAHFRGRHLITTIPAVLSEIERIRTLSFIQNPRSFLEAVQTFLMNQGRQALILESLTVECSESPGPVWFDFALDSFRPTVLLRQLSLLTVQFDWKMFPIPSLTHINLIETRTPVEVTGAQLTSALKEMVNLEFLSIALDDIRLCHYGPNFQSIHLPYLKSLTVFSDRQEEIQPFLSQITHPQLDYLMVHLEAIALNSSSIISSVAASMRKGNFNIPWGLSIYQNDFQIYPAAGELVSDEPSVHVITPITNDERGAETDFAVITDILTCITSLNPSNLSPLRRIHLDKELAIEPDQLIHLFGYLPYLTEIDVGGEHGLILVKALTFSCASGDVNLPTDIPVAFPTLQSITWRAMKEYVAEKLLLPEVFQNLYNSMSMRLQRGCPISKLVLVDYDGLQVSQIETLNEVVRQVDVENSW